MVLKIKPKQSFQPAVMLLCESKFNKVYLLFEADVTLIYKLNLKQSSDRPHEFHVINLYCAP